MSWIGVQLDVRGNGQAILQDYWEYPAFLVHDAYTMHPAGFIDRRGFQRRGIVRPGTPSGGLLAGKCPQAFRLRCGWIGSVAVGSVTLGDAKIQPSGRNAWFGELNPGRYHPPLRHVEIPTVKW